MEYKSKVYTDRPAYAGFDAPNKFQAIQGIIAKRLTEHPRAICSYSGGSDSDIMIALIEQTRQIFNLPPVKYVFFNTGLEMEATKTHVKDTALKYGVEIETIRPKIGIVQATRKYGIPFVSKSMSAGLEKWQKKSVPLSIAEEFENAENKKEKRKELRERYPNCESTINFLCSCDSKGNSHHNQLGIISEKYMLDFLKEYPPRFQISSKCCDYCKKKPAHEIQKDYEMIITGERMAEGGLRTVNTSLYQTSACFGETRTGQYKLRPLYYVSDRDKVWYKNYYKIRYSDAYEVYGLTRTGCCGCPINYKAVADLEVIRPYEPMVVKAAWNVFGASYEYRQKYNKYKVDRKKDPDQITLFDNESGKGGII